MEHDRKDKVIGFWNNRLFISSEYVKVSDVEKALKENAINVPKLVIEHILTTLKNNK